MAEGRQEGKRKTVMKNSSVCVCIIYTSVHKHVPYNYMSLVTISEKYGSFILLFLYRIGFIFAG